MLLTFVALAASGVRNTAIRSPQLNHVTRLAWAFWPIKAR